MRDKSLFDSYWPDCTRFCWRFRPLAGADFVDCFMYDLIGELI